MEIQVSGFTDFSEAWKREHAKGRKLPQKRYKTTKLHLISLTSVKLSLADVNFRMKTSELSCFFCITPATSDYNSRLMVTKSRKALNFAYLILAIWNPFVSFKIYRRANWVMWRSFAAEGGTPSKRARRSDYSPATRSEPTATRRWETPRVGSNRKALGVRWERIVSLSAHFLLEHSDARAPFHWTSVQGKKFSFHANLNLYFHIKSSP